uniref:Uncharacterized protein n=1 Tax=Peromyscus maniculatus bairdii TaxID=230844 RepID=A0A8C8UGD3_PERMB
MRKSAAPNRGSLRGETGRGRPRWEGADHPEEPPPPPPSPGGPHCACASRGTRAHTLSRLPRPPRALGVSSLRAPERCATEVATVAPAGKLRSGVGPHPETPRTPGGDSWGLHPGRPQALVGGRAKER